MQRFYKIGCTSGSIDRRISSMQAGNPFLIKKVGHEICECEDYNPKNGQGCSLENQLLERFSENRNPFLHSENEWFKKSGTLVDYIESLPEK
ncbi:MAG: GIY-YIG nuclease family protein [Candidatus Poribacteria bacterium]|nr:GIY-YIG nuclease family protein [Candidatus Poribacteria bacterium]